MAHRRLAFDELGEGPIRSLRRPLGMTAFGANVIVLPPETEWFHHYHDRQDELYFIHAGRAGFAVDGERFELGPGGAVYVETTTPRRFWNAGEEDLVVLALGGSGGYVERDGHMVDAADVERRRALASGDLDAIRRRRT